MTEIGRLEIALRSARARGSKLLVPYVTGGVADDWTRVISAMSAAGADAIEIGIPFSDPVMDGPTIQEASARSLARGTTPEGIFNELSHLETSVPLIGMTYYNLVFRAGHTRFAQNLAAGGICAAVIPDLPLEESGEWEASSAGAAVETVLLAAPVTPDERLVRIADRARGFIYAVGLMGVTGARGTLASSAAVLAKRLKQITDKPVLIGFGISTPDQAREACEVADGVIVASALMRRYLDGDAPDVIGDRVAELREALDRG